MAYDSLKHLIVMTDDVMDSIKFHQDRKKYFNALTVGMMHMHIFSGKWIRQTSVQRMSWTP